MSPLMRSLAALALLAATTTMPMPSAQAYASDLSVHRQIEKLHGSADQLDEPLLELTLAMKDGDASHIAELSSFPITINSNGESRTIETADEFVRDFDSLIPQRVRNRISHLRYGDLIVNSDGVGGANGAVWWALTCDDDACNSGHWFITSFNVD